MLAWCSSPLIDSPSPRSSVHRKSYWPTLSFFWLHFGRLFYVALRLRLALLNFLHGFFSDTDQFGCSLRAKEKSAALRLSFVLMLCSKSPLRDVFVPPSRRAMALRLIQLWFCFFSSRKNTSWDGLHVTQWQLATTGSLSVVYTPLDLIGCYGSATLST